ncbi:MAG: hypothetical protein H6R01_1514 [Burkholderiaceae bacterium]|nr:hypothetical protein [Burkholderiaceae bacterium]
MTTAHIPTVIGTPFAGGFYAGTVRIEGALHALIVAPKAEGQHEAARWNGSTDEVTGALSYNDGLANTKAMAADGSKLAQWALELNIGGFSDWYLPSLDELEILYRNLKPTEEKNYCWARSGINLHADEPTAPYTPDFPMQTTAKAFRSGGAEAFDPAWHWSSTQHAAHGSCAWMQDFSNGSQHDGRKGSEYRARAVRRIAIQ